MTHIYELVICVCIQALLNSITFYSMVHQVLSQARLSFIQPFIMHSRDADRWHFRQQTFISLTEEAMRTVNLCYCEKPFTKAFSGTQSQHIEPFSFTEIMHQDSFMSNYLQHMFSDG